MSEMRSKARLKLSLKQAMEKFIYDPFEKFYGRELEDIITQNDGLVGARYYIFTHRGTRYTQHRFKTPPQNIPKLYLELQPRFEELLVEKNAIERDERPLVMGYITKILNSTDNTKELLVRFPNSLRPPIEDIFVQLELEVPDLGTDEAAHAVGVCQKSLDALKVRLMTNLILGAR